MSSELPAELLQRNKKYRWYILALLIAIGALVTSLQQSCMPVLFKEISDDLSLDLVQIGTIWGIGYLASVFVGIIAGLLIDRFRAKLILGVFCVLTGITGALRGISNSYSILTTTVLFNGIFRTIIPIATTHTIGIWFKGKNLGLAIGISAMGTGLGLTLGPMISSTVMSPFLGGWRNVLYFYGAIAVTVSILWISFGREPYHVDSDKISSKSASLRQALPKLIRNKGLWLIGLMLLFRVGSLISIIGYLPTYLKDQGWETANADGTLAAFFAISTLCAIPLSYLSDRFTSRKPIIFLALAVTLVCISFIPIVQGGMIWLLVLLTGIFYDGSMSISSAMLLETKGIESAYSGTAIGIVFTLSQIGSVILPPLGNSLASINPGIPFFFWASFSIPAIVLIFFTKETGTRGTNNIINQ